MKETTKKIQGMHCATCALNIEDKVSSLPGIEKTSVNYASEDIQLKYDEKKISLKEVEESMKEIGYSFREDHSHHVDSTSLYFVLPFSAILFVLMILGMFTDIRMMDIPYIEEILFVISTFSLFWAGIPFLKGLLRFLKGKSADMDTLVGLGTTTAYIYSTIVLFTKYFHIETSLPEVMYYEAVIVIIGFVLLGKYIEGRSKQNTGKAIEGLIKLQAKTAIVERNGKEIEISIEDISTNDIMIVKPGEKIPTDGKIVEGSALLDLSMLTGESVPVNKTVGDDVFGGTLNNKGYIKVEAIKTGEDTLLSNIIRMVTEAQNSKAPIQKLVDQISRIFVPTVLILAFLSLIVWLLTGNAILGISSFVATLVIACPCALGLATPTAIVVGVGKSAKEGILVKDADSLEKLNKVDTIIFDKTGTLTHGTPKVTHVNTKIPEKDLLQISYSLESMSQHPLGFAIVEEAKAKGIGKVEVKDFKNIDGMGVRGDIKGETYYIGNTKLMEKNNIKIGMEIDGEEILVANKKEVLGSFHVEDILRDNAQEVIEKLHKKDIHTVLLSGDSNTIAQRVGDAVGIDEIYSEVMPDEKAEIVNKIKGDGKTIAMVGDGINDAPALALADVGIAVATGTQIAIESAQIVLLGGDIGKIPTAITIARDTVRTVRSNLFLAFIYNIIGIPIAMGVLYPFWGILLNPSFAGIAMSLSSVSVVMNSLRLNLKRVDK